MKTQEQAKHYIKGKTYYRIVFDEGKPYEEIVYGELALTKALKDFYEKNKNKDYPYDAHVYDSECNDITESQFIEEIVGEFLEAIS